jgi:hypothetical protein
MEKSKAMNERPYEPAISPVGKLVIAVIIAFGLFGSFGWLLI